MKKIRIVTIVGCYLALFILFQFACVKKVPRFAPGDEFLSSLDLMSEKDYRGLIDQTKTLELSSLKEEQAEKIAFMTGLAALSLNENETAVTYLEYCRKNYHVIEDHVLYHLAKAYYAAGNYPAAFEAAKYCIDTYPDSIWHKELAVMLGERHAALGQYDEALVVYDAYLSDNKKEKNYPDVLLLKAQTLEKMGKSDRALSVYEDIWIGYPASNVAGKSFEGITRLGGSGNMKLSKVKKRIDNLYAVGSYDTVVSEIGRIPTLTGTRLEGLSEATRKDFDYIKARSYFKSRKYRMAKELFEALLSNPGAIPRVELLYWRARSYDRLEQDDTAVAYYLDIFAKYPKDDLAEESLYLAAQTLEEIKRYDEAIHYYETYIATYSRGNKVKDVLWDIGWLHYMKKEYNPAEEYFNRMAQSYREAREYPQYLYWKARAIEHQNRPSEAIPLYRTISEKYVATYYGLASEMRLKKLGVAFEPGPKKKGLDESYWTKGFGSIDSFTSDEKITVHLRRALELMTMNMDETAESELSLVVDRCVGEPDLLIEVARLLRYSGDYYTPLLIAANRFSHNLTEYRRGENDVYWQMKYPQAYKKEVDRYTADYDLDPAFVYAVMREESLFQPRVISWAGAIGLMQIMPGTGKSIAAELGITEFNTEQLKEYPTNIRFGVYYLSGLMKNHGNEQVYALCGYNAGPGNIMKWIKNADPDMEIDEFIENIPFSETRAYVKRILNTESIYKAVYEGDDR